MHAIKIIRCTGCELMFEVGATHCRLCSARLKLGDLSETIFEYGKIGESAVAAAIESALCETAFRYGIATKVGSAVDNDQ